MIIVDKYLQARARDGNPIRVGIVGAGQMAKGLVHQITHYTPGMVVAAIANRTVDNAVLVYRAAGQEPVLCHSLASLQECIVNGKPAVTEDAELLCELEGLDLLVEITGNIPFAAQLIFKAIQHKKNVLMFSPEIDATVGPILKVYGQKAGVMLSGSDGDQPGAIMNLYRNVKGMGLTPLICGNIKGLQDFYRTPATQAAFAAIWDLKPESATCYADGTKISFEQACVANATGMGVARRGMVGYYFDGHIDDMTSRYDVGALKRMGGMVDYVVGTKPGPGVYVFATTDDPVLKRALKYMKLGDGPLYSFYTPFHLIFMEVPFSIARMVLSRDIIMESIAGPVVEVVAFAKTDLKAGKKLDGIGGFDVYGQCENAATVHEEGLLPIGICEGAILKRDLPRDYVLTYDDVEMPEDNFLLRLYDEQTRMFFPKTQKDKTPVIESNF